MPRLEPTSEETAWAPGELTIGVVGVAPWATLEFCRALYGLVDATKDWHYPRLLIDANSKIPSRGRHLQLGAVDPSPAIRLTIAELVQAGAGVVVVPCNTAHLLHARWAEGAAVPVPHIMKVAAERVAAQGGAAVAVLESSSLRASGAYGEIARARGLRTVPLSDGEANVVSGLIAAIKLGGGLGPADAASFRALADAVLARGADSLLLGCTELGVLAPIAPPGCLVVDSNVELARAALVHAGSPLREDR